ncbi:hypothetical protein [Listeria booriae]|uniref:hypothetical protein n=1 Tax=Listeria booriae TaxID=1552123 RepID=UPI0016254897|nr:hypothetical protein [Listeria booriae]
MARLHITFPEESKSPYGISYLQAQMARFDCSASKAIEKIFEEHAGLLEEQQGHVTLIENTYQRFKKDLDITRIRAGHTDKNSQIIIELLNTIIFHNKIQQSLLTDQLETTPVTEAKQLIESKIQSYMEKRASKKYGGGTTSSSGMATNKSINEVVE